MGGGGGIVMIYISRWKKRTKEVSEGKERWRGVKKKKVTDWSKDGL